MVDLNALYQSGDWKAEKHVPVIEVQGSPKKGDVIKVNVSIGKQIPHPNKTEHHISWIEVYFQPEGEKYPIQIGKYSFDAHGASAKGPDTSSVYSLPEVNVAFKSEKSGTIIALSYCNIHGLWRNVLDIKIA